MPPSHTQFLPRVAFFLRLGLPSRRVPDTMYMMHCPRQCSPVAFLRSRAPPFLSLACPGAWRSLSRQCSIPLHSRRRRTCFCWPSSQFLPLWVPSTSVRGSAAHDCHRVRSADGCVPTISRPRTNGSRMRSGRRYTVRPVRSAYTSPAHEIPRYTGDVIYIYMLGNPIIVLNSSEVINDLFEKRGSLYSSRPCRTMVNELYVIFGRSS